MSSSPLSGMTSDFVNSIEQSLSQGDAVHARTLFDDNRNRVEVQNNAWDLIPVVTAHLTASRKSENVCVFKCCEYLINAIARESKPEEALLQFIEEIEAAADDTKFVALLRPLETVLLRVPDKRLTSLAWCFNSIQAYLKRVAEDVGPQRVCYLYTIVLGFYDVFIEEIRGAVVVNPNRRILIGKFLVQLLGEPFVYFDLELSDDKVSCSTEALGKSDIRKVAENFVEKILNVSADPFIFLTFRHVTYNAELIKPSDLGLSVFYYLVLAEHICLKQIPKVYDSVYLFQNSLYLVNVLLKEEDNSNNSFSLLKGLKLIETLLKLIDGIDLSYLLLDSPDHSRFCLILTNITIFNDDKTVRIRCLKILEKYLWSFEIKAKYLLILNLISTVNHNGLIGYLITQYKEIVMREIRQNYKNMPDYVNGKKLFALLDRFCLLKDNEQTDLVDNADQIISCLNLLRCIFIADTNGNTLIYWYDEKLERYFKNLREAIVLCRNNYNGKIRELEVETNLDQGAGDDQSDCQMSLTVAGENLPELSKQKKIEIVKMSLTTVDVISGLLDRVKQVYSDVNKKAEQEVDEILTGL